jgi:hypothetical protein
MRCLASFRQVVAPPGLRPYLKSFTQPRELLRPPPWIPPRPTGSGPAETPSPAAAGRKRASASRAPSGTPSRPRRSRGSAWPAGGWRTTPPASMPGSAPTGCSARPGTVAPPPVSPSGSPTTTPISGVKPPSPTAGSSGPSGCWMAWLPPPSTRCWPTRRRTSLSWVSATPWLPEG